MALAPLQAYFKIPAAMRWSSSFSLPEKHANTLKRELQQDALAVSTFESSSAVLTLGGTKVTVAQISEFPSVGKSELHFKLTKPAMFVVQVRVPTWAAPLKVKLNGKKVKAKIHDGWAILPARQWEDGDRLALTFNLVPQLVPGDHGNAGLAALTYGPFVMACDTDHNPGLPSPATLSFATKKPAKLRAGTEKLPAVVVPVTALKLAGKRDAVFVSYADAGTDGKDFCVWLQAPTAK
jgi:DUF1680 family protein